MDTQCNEWNIFSHDFPVAGTAAQQWKFLLQYAVLAPSNHNTQPWLFRILGRDVELYADRTRALAVLDPDDRELIISCGTALLNLRVAMEHFGVNGGVALFPAPENPDLLARCTLGASLQSAVQWRPLLQAILKRRTNRQPFRDQRVPAGLLKELRIAAEGEGAWLDVAETELLRERLASLIAESDRVQWSQKSFRREIAAWVRPNRDPSRDGIPASFKGIGDVLSYAGPTVIRRFDMGAGRAAHDHEIALGSPALVVISTAADNPAAWLAAGQALERALLLARQDNVWASFLNQPIEIPIFRSRVNEITGRDGFAQLILRLGFADDVNPTPRRTVDEVLLKSPPTTAKLRPTHG